MSHIDNGSPSTLRIRTLTVGDGDLTLSLALSRAYGSDQIDLTASTLCSSQQELCRTYDNAQEVVAELEQRRVSIRYGIDATHLYETIKPDFPFDIVLFSHPHLGYSSLLEEKDEAKHAARHFVLLAHYFASAQSCLKKPGGAVHLCLCGTQPQTWRVHDAAERQGLTCRSKVSTTVPPHTTWLSRSSATAQEQTEPLTLKPVENHFPAPRKYRSGKLGSKHFLGKYGYCHRRNHGQDDAYAGNQVDTNVSGSVHLIFTQTDQKHTMEASRRKDPLACDVCGTKLQSIEQLELHMRAPALPDTLDKPEIERSEEAKQCRSSASVNDECVQDSKRASQTDGNLSRNTKRRQVEKTWNSGRVLNDHDGVRETLMVEAPNDGKRLRWYLRQPSVSDMKLSKKQCDNLIAAGRIAVNGTVALDSGRVLHTGDAVAVLQEGEMTTSVVDDELVKSKVLVVCELKEENNLLVAFKPVGMRCIGNFSEQTLEMTMSRARGGRPYKSISKLDTGCSGLCVLQDMSSIGKPESVIVTHVFTALVHGIAPKSWTESSVKLQLGAKARRWRNQRQASSVRAVESDEDDIVEEESTATHRSDTNNITSDDATETIRIECTEQTTINGVAELSSIRISTNSGSSGLCNAICYQLRKLGHPVVNDRLCRQEYMSMPRSIRNAIKKKLCIGCFDVDISIGGRKEIPISTNCPDRLSALYWEKTVAGKVRGIQISF